MRSVLQKSFANWSKQIMRDLAPSPALLKSADTISIPWTLDALDSGQADAFPFWPTSRSRDDGHTNSQRVYTTMRSAWRKIRKDNNDSIDSMNSGKESE